MRRNTSNNNSINKINDLINDIENTIGGHGIEKKYQTILIVVENSITI